jgi:PAS domain S-box-containing protein
VSRKRGQPWCRAAALGALVALVSGGVTAGVATVLHRGERTDASVQMDRRTAAAAAAVQAETRRYVDTLLTTAAAVGAQQTLTASEYATLTAPLHSMRLAGATSIALIVPATDGEIPRVERTWRDRGMPDLRLHPQGAGDHAFSVLAAALDGTPAQAGLDVMQAAAPAAALAEARRSRQVSVSPTYQLLVDRSRPAAERQNSFVLAAPVYQGVGQTFLGWLLFGVRGQDFMGATLQAAGTGLTDLRLEADEADGRAVTVAAMHHRAGGDPDLRRVVAVPVADSTWTLRLTAAHGDLPGGRTGLATAVAGGGSCLTLLLAALVWVLATGQERAQARVRAATTELVAEQAETSRQAGLLQAVVDSISDGVGVVGPDGTFLLHNPAARDILGQTETPAGGAETWHQHFGLYRPDGVTPLPPEEMPLVRALGGECADQVEMVVRNATHPDGRVISVSARPVDTTRGRRGAVAVFHDITDRKRVETELRGFAGVVAHDLKAPLTLVSAYAELVAEALDDLAAGAGTARLDQARRHTAKVLHGAGRMSRLITELLDYTAARDATLRVERLSLRALVDDVVTTRTDAPGHEPGTRPDVFVGPLPDVYADPVLLRQVVDNLVGNAVKYTPPGQAPRIDITARTDENGIRVRIADRGIGIPDGEHAAVFDSFHRASNGTAHPGTGLGLAICRRIVERHGGHIDASPNPGGGTIFSFTLPATAADAATQAAAPARKPVTAG